MQFGDETKSIRESFRKAISESGYSVKWITLYNQGHREFKTRRAREETDKSITGKLAEIDSSTINISGFLKLAKKYTSFDEITPGMLHDLIEKIVVHEGDKSSGHRQQRIDIYYTFIGATEDSQVVAKLKLKGKAA